MYLLKITAKATPANKKYPGVTKVWYQGKGARFNWEDTPEKLHGQEWKKRSYALRMLEVMTEKFKPMDDFWGMWVHSLEVVEIG